MRAKSKGISKGSKIILLLALIIACLVGFGLYQYLYTQKITVYLYSDNFPQGTLITKEMFASTQMDISTSNAMAGTGNRYMTADDIMHSIEAGERLLVGVAKYTVASANQYVASGGTAIESRLAKNMVSVELPIEKVSGLSAGVRIGSHINVITGYTVDSAKTADLIFQDLLIVDVVHNSEGGIKSVYVEVEPTESVRLIHSVMFESVAASIIKPGSYVPVNNSEASYRRDYSPDINVNGYLYETQPGMNPIQQSNGVTLGQEVNN